MPTRPDEQALISFNAEIDVWVTPQDIRLWPEFDKAIQENWDNEYILRQVAAEKLYALEAEAEAEKAINITSQYPEISKDTLDWDKIRRQEAPLEVEDPMFGQASLHVQAKGGNESQQAANEAIKVAKELQDLLATLAGLPHREEIATAAGLTDLQTMIERVYELADRYRQGGVTQLRPAYAGWDPDRIRENNIDLKPIDKDVNIDKVRNEPAAAEKYRFPNERASDPRTAETPLDIDP